jgi:hypothetical protein
VNCRHCGTEISDKAIVCFRCGQATSGPDDARRPAAAGPRRQPLWLAAIALFVLVAGGLLMAQAAAGRVSPWISYTVAALAAIVLAWRIMRRRRT